MPAGAIGMSQSNRSGDLTPALLNIAATASLWRWLNVGSGVAGSGLRPPGMCEPNWVEVRLDADPAVLPDIESAANDLQGVSSASFDAVFSSHCIEHLYLDQALPALCEWRRVLREQGFLLLVCPDLQAAAEMIADDRLFDVAYAGITPFDIVFSHQGLVSQGRAAGHHWMEHRSGYTLSSLTQLVSQAGFEGFAGLRLRPRFELWLVATVNKRSEEALRQLAQQHFLHVQRQQQDHSQKPRP